MDLEIFTKHVLLVWLSPLVVGMITKDCWTPCSGTIPCLSHSCFRKGLVTRCELQVISADSSDNKNVTCVGPKDVSGIKGFCQHVLDQQLGPVENIQDYDDEKVTTTESDVTPTPIVDTRACFPVAMLLGVSVAAFVSGATIMCLFLTVVLDKIKGRCRSQKTAPEVEKNTAGSRPDSRRHFLNPSYRLQRYEKRLLSSESSDSGLSSPQAETPVSALPSPVAVTIAPSTPHLQTTPVETPSYTCTGSTTGTARSTGSRQDDHDYECINSDDEAADGATESNKPRTDVQQQCATSDSSKEADSPYEALGAKKAADACKVESEDHDYTSMNGDEDTLGRERQQGTQSPYHDYLCLEEGPAGNTEAATLAVRGLVLDDGRCRGMSVASTSHRDTDHPYFVLEKQEFPCNNCHANSANTTVPSSKVVHNYVNISE